MLVTAEEAKTCWCCLGAYHCRGGTCMAWRWHDGEFCPPTRGLRLFFPVNGDPARYSAESPPRPMDVPDSWEWEGSTSCWVEQEEEYLARVQVKRDEYDSVRRGYCGLAGKPEVA